MGKERLFPKENQDFGFSSVDVIIASVCQLPCSLLEADIDDIYFILKNPINQPFFHSSLAAVCKTTLLNSPATYIIQTCYDSSFSPKMPSTVTQDLWLCLSKEILVASGMIAIPCSNFREHTIKLPQDNPFHKCLRKFVHTPVFQDAFIYFILSV